MLKTHNMIKVYIFIFVSIKSFANVFPDGTNEIIKDIVKIKLEEQVENLFNKPVLCPHSNGNCAIAYNKLLNLKGMNESIFLSKVNKILIKERSTENSLYLDSRGNLNFPYYIDLEVLKTQLELMHREKYKNYILETLISLGQNTSQEYSDFDIELLGPRYSCDEMSSFYENLFLDGEFRVTIVRGYYDNGGEEKNQSEYQVSVERDLYSFNILIKKLSGYGFRVDYEYRKGVNDQKIYVEMSKDFYLNRKLYKARVRLARSTILCEGEHILNGKVIREASKELCKDQKDAISFARDIFAEGVLNDHFVTYSGHSRYGKGPDFGPYNKKYGKFGIKNGVLNSIDMPQKRDLILFLNSCSSKKHFTDSINRYRKKLGKENNQSLLTYVSNTKSEDWSNRKMEIRLIKGLMEGKCINELKDYVELFKLSLGESKLIINGLEL